MRRKIRFSSHIKRFVGTAVIACAIHSLRAADVAGPVAAKPADTFVESCAVCTHLTYRDEIYFSRWPEVKARLFELGIRHIRDGGADGDFIKKTRELASGGVRTVLIMDPGSGVVPDETFWTPSSAPRQLLTNFIAKIGPQTLSAIEVMNEIDIFYDRKWIKDYAQAGLFWVPNNTAPTNRISGDEKSPLWWGNYIQAMTRATWRAVKSNPASAKIPIIGPCFGNFHDHPPTGKNSLRDFVDWGGVHPYPFGGNPFSDRAGYAGVDWYIGHGQQPSCNIDEWPMAFTSYQGAFGDKPMTATETGWFTGAAEKAVSEATQAKYVPRLYLEYFRRGFKLCSHYEFLDESTDRNNNEHNRGLVRFDLSPKPAFIALRNLLGLLRDPGPAFAAGTLDYTITKQMPEGYNRPQYVRDLLLEKRDGTFWLVLWHEIASSSTYTATSQEIKGPARDLHHPDVPVTITFGPGVKVLRAERFNPQVNARAIETFDRPHELRLNVQDEAMVVKIELQK